MINYHIKGSMDKTKYKIYKTLRGRFIIIHNDDINTIRKFGSGFTKLDETFKPQKLI